MGAFPRRHFWIALRYRLSILGVCLAYLLAALEVPLPVFVHKISSQPFPCQNHPCGCQTAEQCWSNCCCFTPEERWAWAREHNVEPPAYAEKPCDQPPTQGWNSVKLRDRDCCTKETNCCCTREPAAPAKERSIVWVTTMAAWRCQGHSILWISTGAVLPVSRFAAWSPDDVPPAFVCLLALHADIVPATPPDPPPRSSHV